MLNYHDLSVCTGGPWLGNITVPEMTPGQILPMESIIQDLKNGQRGGNIAITGGEPLLHPEIMDIVHECVCNGFRRIKILTDGKRFTEIEFLLNIIYAGAYMFEIMAFGLEELKKGLTINSLKKSWVGLRNIRKITDWNSNFQKIYLALVVPVCQASYQRLNDILSTIIGSITVDRIIFCWGSPELNIWDAGNFIGSALDRCRKNRIWAFTRGIPLCAIPEKVYHIEELYLLNAKKGGFTLTQPCDGCWAGELCSRMPAAGLKYFWNPKPLDENKYTPYIKDILAKGFIFDNTNETLYCR
jgi:hypothetical protein